MLLEPESISALLHYDQDGFRFRGNDTLFLTYKRNYHVEIKNNFIAITTKKHKKNYSVSLKYETKFDQSLNETYEETDEE